MRNPFWQSRASSLSNNQSIRPHSPPRDPARGSALLLFSCSVFCLAQFALLFIFLRPILLLRRGPSSIHFFQPITLLASWLLAQEVNQGNRILFRRVFKTFLASTNNILPPHPLYHDDRGAVNADYFGHVLFWIYLCLLFFPFPPVVLQMRSLSLLCLGHHHGFFFYACLLFFLWCGWWIILAREIDGGGRRGEGFQPDLVFPRQAGTGSGGPYDGARVLLYTVDRIIFSWGTNCIHNFFNMHRSYMAQLF